MAKRAADFVEEARREVPSIDVEEAAQMLHRDDVVFVDVRETTEYQQGTIPGAVHVPRGLLEWYADPTLPVHRSELSPEKTLVVFCAAGGRSLLAAKTLREMGYPKVVNLEGGFTAWREAGKPVTHR